MALLFETLPGQEMPMPQVESALAKMWAVEREAPGIDALPSEYRASQMNLILHFGLETEEAEANALFQTALGFARRYPCRIVVLCPSDEGDAEPHHRAKLFSQCYVGRGLRQRTCCEALMLRYHLHEADFLDNMVSIWLENDLPTSYYCYKIPPAKIEAHLLEFVRKCRRVLYDSSVETEDLSAVAWPQPALVRDLARARLLPLRQSLGQFLSGTPPSALCEGLTTVRLDASERMRGEGRNLLAWVGDCLEGCARASGIGSTFQTQFEARPGDDAHLSMEWTYASSDKHLEWTLDRETESASLTADFGTGRVSFSLHAGFLSPEKTLAEACFFD
ncbi:MAG: glucose-6-phosphate dehydrogenase assembly protein OpcA [Opitutales bacterium]